MDILEINKTLSNQIRIDILDWLKTPETHFPKQVNVPDFSDGVCVCHIQEKTGLSQSTVSHYLSMMNKAGLLIPTRHGKWTYYKRNEEVIQKYIEFLRQNL